MEENVIGFRENLHKIHTQKTDASNGILNMLEMAAQNLVITKLFVDYDN